MDSLPSLVPSAHAAPKPEPVPSNLQASATRL